MYNGWRNYQTWNAALWIANDEFLFELARETGSYARFVERIRESNPETSIGYETPDGVSWKDSSIDTEAINRTIFQGE
jgi:hypothetical protein